MRLDLPGADDAFVKFFLDLGYEVHAVQGPVRFRGCGRPSTVERWYEIYGGGGGERVLQISMPPPQVAELVADLPHFVRGEPGVGPTDYWCACVDVDRLRDLLARAQRAEEERCRP